jgi:hypothetical protein
VLRITPGDSPNVEQTVARDDPDPTALACYGLLARCWDAASRRSEDLWLRFVEGRPVSAVTIDFLTWCADRAQEHCKRAVLVIWDNASWHDNIVRTWVRQGRPGLRRLWLRSGTASDPTSPQCPQIKESGLILH